MSNESNISYKQEILRKGIHLASLSIPISYIFFTRENMLSVLVPATILFVIFDILSKNVHFFINLMLKYFGQMLRPHEKKGKGFFNGATWVLISATICVLAFPKIITITGFTILIISDICAALIGRRFGKHGFFDKSWEGTISFIVSAIAIIFIYYNLFDLPFSYLIIGVIAATIGGFVEAVSKVIKIDDNLSIPISVGLVMLAGEYFYGLSGQSFLGFLN
jgi:dolichol kinase